MEEHRWGVVMAAARRSCRRIYLGSGPMAHHIHGTPHERERLSASTALAVHLPATGTARSRPRPWTMHHSPSPPARLRDLCTCRSRGRSNTPPPSQTPMICFLIVSGNKVKGPAGGFCVYYCGSKSRLFFFQSISVHEARTSRWANDMGRLWLATPWPAHAQNQHRAC